MPGGGPKSNIKARFKGNQAQMLSLAITLYNQHLLHNDKLNKKLRVAMRLNKIITHYSELHFSQHYTN